MSIISSISKLSGWYRILTLASVIWFLVILINTNPWTKHGSRGSSNNWDEFIGLGVLPIIVVWGIIWVIRGFKKN